MELTDEQRAEIAAIREQALASASHPYSRAARPGGGKEAFKAWARKLDALGDPRKPPRPHMDADELAQWNEAERARIEGALADFGLPPTIIVDSGGGYQGLWRLDELFYVGGTAERWGNIEAYNRQLAADLGGDHCHNIERILRVAGTVNWPDEKKKAKGGRHGGPWPTGPTRRTRSTNSPRRPRTARG